MKRLGLAGLVVLVVASGCTKRVAVSGRVVDNNRPVAWAELRWIDESEKVFVSGVSNQDGVYRLDAAGRSEIPVGKYKVTVTWWRTPNGKPLPAGEERTAIKSISQMMTATLDIQVTDPTTTLDLDITGRSAPNP